MDLREMISIDRIKVNVEARDWKESIEKVGELMVNTQCVFPEYVEAMKKVAESLGPYIVITPGVAFPHARPEDGVMKPCFALITLKNPINFGNPENDPVKMVIALAAIDNSQHIQALKTLVDILSQRELVEKMMDASTEEELYNYLINCHPSEV
jgi:mannitol/fructose-specific phosphotransferase system IIA component (Ntr-type)